MGLSVSQDEEYPTPPESPYEYKYATSVVPSSSPGGHKGLKNAIGENNCFLNVVVQALWHLVSSWKPCLSFSFYRIAESNPHSEGFLSKQFRRRRGTFLVSALPIPAYIVLSRYLFFANY